MTRRLLIQNRKEKIVNLTNKKQTLQSKKPPKKHLKALHKELIIIKNLLLEVKNNQIADLNQIKLLILLRLTQKQSITALLIHERTVLRNLRMQAQKMLTVNQRRKEILVQNNENQLMILVVKRVA